MSAAAFVSLGVLIVALLVSIGPLGRYMAKVYRDDKAPGDRVFLPVERWIYRLLRVDPKREQRWNVYTMSLLAFSFISVVALYIFQRVQTWLPLNNGLPNVVPKVAFNTAVSFVTNTNWQSYSGESTMGHLVQMAGLTVQNFLSAAVGMAVAAALIRSLARRTGRTLGNFWVDVTRTTTRILLPISFVIALVLVSQGAIQNFRHSTAATTVDQTAQTVQNIPGGPFGSQEAIKELGTNGGGPLNANSAHPFENPTRFTNLLEIYALLVIGFAFPITYGVMVGSKRQGRVVLAVMASLWLTVALMAGFFEQAGNPNLTRLGADQSLSSTQAGGNTEGKEIRYGPAASGVFAASTTGTSTGSVDAMHDSFTPLGGAIPLVNMKLGEVSPGGVGVGLVGMLINAIMAVFIAGLMVGRTPELLGKKIQAAEMKLVVLYILAMPLASLAFAAASVLLGTALAGRLNTGPHGLTEMMYAFTSATNNNGSAFGGLTVTSNWYQTTLGLCMLIGRFFLIIPTLAIGGSLVRKQKVPSTSGTFPTDTPLFGGLVLGVVLIVAGLTFFPILALAPIVEHLGH
ncbi:MAG: potassium-transporting ATPase potassium-binding subunit [Acidimicrobiaceae bacterium]|nr:potassium-transporting ATPase potassium-binding subunit [Acidimicrobiaceae bacterium]